MARRSALVVLAVIAAAGAPGCGDVCACPPAQALGIAYGTITDQSGTPIAGALVTVSTLRDSIVVDLGFGSTGSAGRYRVLAGGLMDDSLAVFLRVRASVTASYEQTSDPPQWLDFRYEPPFDSVRIDAAVPQP